MKLETINPVINATPSTPDHSTPVDYIKIGGIQIWYKNDPNAAGSAWFESREEALKATSFISKCLKLAKVKSPNDYMKWIDRALETAQSESRKKDIDKYNAMFERVFGENNYQVCPFDQSFTDLEIMSRCDADTRKWGSEFLLTSDEGKHGFTEYRFSYNCYDAKEGVTDWCEDSKVFDNEIDAIRHIINRIVNEKISQHEQD